MIAEARSDWYFILDGDEIYNPEALDALEDEVIGRVVDQVLDVESERLQVRVVGHKSLAFGVGNILT